jgi:hypothetical protein
MKYERSVILVDPKDHKELRAPNKMRSQRPPTNQRASERHERFVKLWEGFLDSV